MFFSVITKNSNCQILTKNLVTFIRWGYKQKTLIFWGLIESLKTNLEGGLPKKGAWTVCRFKGRARQERGGRAFEGGT